MSKGPLVSIIIICENDTKYLDECYQSILKQNYKNIEIIFRDNNSDDDSYEKSVSYSSAFRNEKMSINCSKNKKRYSYPNCVGKCMGNVEGDYLYFMSPKNRMQPTFVESLVRAFENENVGLVVCSQNMMFEGEIVDSRKMKKEEDIAERLVKEANLWIGQVARRKIYDVLWSKYNVTFNTYKHIYESFLVSCVSSVEVIEEPLIQIEMGEFELEDTERDMTAIFERYLLQLAFIDASRKLKNSKVMQYKENAMENIANLCIAKAVRMLSFGDDELAKKYLQMSKVFKLDIFETENYKKVENIIADKGMPDESLIDWCKEEGILCQM